MKNDLIKLFEEHQKWSSEKFKNSTWDSSLIGLKREVDECLNEGNRLIEIADLDLSLENLGLEYVDCFMYLIDSMGRAGIDLEFFVELFQQKLQINKERDWLQNEDKTYSHVK